ncbi:unnamed protein product, partial [Prorocentrum cordatum]
EQGPWQADGTRLVVKNGFLEVVDPAAGLSRSKSDGHLVCALGGGTAQVDAARVAPRSATERPTRADSCLHVSAAEDATSHRALSVTSRSRPSKAARLRCKQLLVALDGTREADLNAAWGLADGGGSNAAVGLAARRRDERYMLSILKAKEREQTAAQGPAQAAS